MGTFSKRYSLVRNMKVFALLCLVAVASAKTRTGRLPENVWRNIPMLRHEINEKIVGGDEVIPHSIPHQVSLQYKFIDFHFCGGSVVNSDTIMTAAHCCDGQSASELKVVAGDHNLARDEGTEQTVDVSRIIMHPDYNPRTIYNDICILKLEKDMDINSYVKGVSLPYQNEEFSGKGTVSGWGTLSSGGSSPDTLHSVDVPIVSDESCRDSYGESDIADSMICAGERGKDSCQGDSGGPLTCGGSHCGVVSWGYGCAVAGYPGVYTQTSYFMDFINMHS